jgi:hypothetical protein
MPNARRSHKIDIIAPQEQNEAETVPVRLMKELTVKVIGETTKNIYTFIGAGSIVNVDKLDLESIRKKNYVHKSCCGSYSSPYFDIL